MPWSDQNNTASKAPADTKPARQSSIGYLIFSNMVQRALGRGQESSFVGLGLQSEEQERVRTIQRNGLKLVSHYKSVVSRLDNVRNNFIGRMLDRTSRQLELGSDPEFKKLSEQTAQNVSHLYFHHLRNTFWDDPNRYQSVKVRPGEVVEQLQASLDGLFTDETDFDTHIVKLRNLLKHVAEQDIGRLTQKSEKLKKWLDDQYKTPVGNEIEKERQRVLASIIPGESTEKTQFSRQVGVLLEAFGAEFKNIKPINNSKFIKDYKTRLLNQTLATLDAVEFLFEKHVVRNYIDYAVNNDKNTEQARTFEGVLYFELHPGDRDGEITKERMGHYLVRVVRADGSSIVRRPRQGETPSGEFFQESANREPLLHRVFAWAKGPVAVERSAAKPDADGNNGSLEGGR